MLTENLWSPVERTFTVTPDIATFALLLGKTGRGGGEGEIRRISHEIDME